MSQSSPPPTLTPQFCFNTVALRDFLRISRGAIDDSIAQNLNDLWIPSASGFDPSSTSTRIPRPSKSRTISPHSCRSFKNQVLFPSWQARSDVLTYCAKVAASPDPLDPDLVLRQVESARQKEKIVDERLDPYSARYFPTESRTEKLAAIIKQERGIENIIRERSWRLVSERCGDDWRDWETASKEWEKGKESR